MKYSVYKSGWDGVKENKKGKAEMEKFLSYKIISEIVDALFDKEFS